MNINIKNENLIRLTINDNENEFIEFDPFDIVFINEFKKMGDYLTNLKESSIDEIEEVFIKIDNMMNKHFGKDATKYLFNNRHNISLYNQFFSQITPYIQKERENLVNKYINK